MKLFPPNFGLNSTEYILTIDILGYHNFLLWTELALPTLKGGVNLLKLFTFKEKPEYVSRDSNQLHKFFTC